MMEELFTIFENLQVPYYRQGSLSSDEYDSSFFTFQNFDTPNDSFYDNHETRYIEKVQVCFYTNDPNLIYSKMNEFILAAKTAGLVVEGKGYDTPADRNDYFGRRIIVNIIHKED
jgi:hypothetical protein